MTETKTFKQLQEEFQEKKGAFLLAKLQLGTYRAALGEAADELSMSPPEPHTDAAKLLMLLHEARRRVAFLEAENALLRARLTAKQCLP